ncbi:hypothetical protein QQP08_023417 [Theobroma cacao]|nr:hypothetical protein QQP08_023417 [Theobroma cacao]
MEQIVLECAYKLTSPSSHFPLLESVLNQESQSGRRRLRVEHYPPAHTVLTPDKPKLLTCADPYSTNDQLASHIKQFDFLIIIFPLGKRERFVWVRAQKGKSSG